MVMDRGIRTVHTPNWNLAEEYANRFHLPGKEAIEAEWQFRRRIARNLEEMGERLPAHEVLYNQRMTDDLFAYGELSSGYGNEFITRIAQQTEIDLQYTRQQQRREQKWQRLLSTFRIRQKPRLDE